MNALRRYHGAEQATSAGEAIQNIHLGTVYGNEQLLLKIIIIIH